MHEAKNAGTLSLKEKNYLSLDFGKRSAGNALIPEGWRGESLWWDIVPVATTTKPTSETHSEEKTFSLLHHA